MPFDQRTTRYLQKRKGRNALIFSTLVASVFSIYAYSIFAVKQESFDDVELKPRVK